jgi:shikimate dehydrogenase
VEFDEQFRMLCGRIRQRKVLGLNVTIPHKQAVIPILDELTETAQNIRAVNTILLSGEILTGHNTDVDGFLRDLLSQMRHYNYAWAFDADRKDLVVLILGAGGSARAVVYGCLREGFSVTIAARRSQQAQDLVASVSTNLQLDPKSIPVVIPLDHNSLYRFSCSSSKHVVIVNTTPLGMMPELDGSPWPMDLDFPEGAFIYDLVYNPRETSLVRLARRCGLPAVTGLGMLIEQAALSFECWTGKPVAREVMWKAVQENKG